jgi:hypothetical protein
VWFPGSEVEQLPRCQFVGLAESGEVDSAFQAMHRNLAGAWCSAISLPKVIARRTTSIQLVLTKVVVFAVTNDGPKGRTPMTSPARA